MGDVVKGSSLTVERLRELLHYDEVTGVFTRRVSAGTRKAGTVSGCARPDGYIGISIDARDYKAHRLAWFYVHEKWPDEQIDHINGARHDNRLVNLRECTNAENHQNLGRHADNNTGYQGVTFRKKTGRWIAQITRDGQNIYLGVHATPEDAHAAYLEAKAQFHPFQPTTRDRGNHENASA